MDSSLHHQVKKIIAAVHREAKAGHVIWHLRTPYPWLCISLNCDRSERKPMYILRIDLQFHVTLLCEPSDWSSRNRSSVRGSCAAAATGARGEAGLVAAALGAPFAIVSGGLATVLMTGWIAWKYPQLREYRTVRDPDLAYCLSGCWNLRARI